MLQSCNDIFNFPKSTFDLLYQRRFRGTMGVDILVPTFSAV